VSTQFRLNTANLFSNAIFIGTNLA
jgi:hypothetical protein